MDESIDIFFCMDTAKKLTDRFGAKMAYDVVLGLEEVARQRQDSFALIQLEFIRRILLFS